MFKNKTCSRSVVLGQEKKIYVAQKKVWILVWTFKSCIKVVLKKIDVFGGIFVCLNCEINITVQPKILVHGYGMGFI